jgi:hypothetical protein
MVRPSGVLSKTFVPALVLVLKVGSKTGVMRQLHNSTYLECGYIRMRYNTTCLVHGWWDCAWLLGRIGVRGLADYSSFCSIVQRNQFAWSHNVISTCLLVLPPPWHCCLLDEWDLVNLKFLGNEDCASLYIIRSQPPTTFGSVFLLVEGNPKCFRFILVWFQSDLRPLRTQCEFPSCLRKLQLVWFSL